MKNNNSLAHINSPQLKTFLSSNKSHQKIFLLLRNLMEYVRNDSQGFLVNQLVLKEQFIMHDSIANFTGKSYVRVVKKNLILKGLNY